MTQPTQKTVPIRNGRGEVTGYITVYWSEVHRCYFTVPGRD